MKQVIEELKTGGVRVDENSAPQCGRTESLIRNVASLIDLGIEKLTSEMDKKRLMGKSIARLNLLSRRYQTKCA